MLEAKIGGHFPSKPSRDGKEMYKKRAECARAELLLLLSDVAVAVAIVVS